ncbi:MAG TPA: Vps62-related protein, partial [Jatrophihabitans sp.]|nr:Vps62-related protein [Jatrophihabitans sp.]
QPDEPGHLALQYWFYYLYNDFNDKHESDWEMIQLDFRADDATAALNADPYEIGYSQHTGAERAEWGDAKLEIVDGTHPVVYPAHGSHANYYSAHLFLGRSAAEGVGCDDTLGPSRTVRPNVVVLLQARAQYLQQFPWLGFEGRWGERQKAFNDGPTGPSSKPRWSEPFTWMRDYWRDDAFAVPDGGLLGDTATSFFCTAVAKGSAVLNAILDNPTPVIAALAVLLLLIVWLAARTSWRPAVVFRVRRRRPWGTLVTSAARLYATHVRTFGGIGLLFIPIGLITAGVQYLLFEHGMLTPLTHIAGKSNPVTALLLASLGAAFTLIGLTAVQGATAFAVVELDDGRTVTAGAALRRSLAKARSLFVGLLVAVLVIGGLSLSVVGAPVGAYLLVRWSLLAQAAVIGNTTALRASFRVTRGHFWRTASVTVFVTGLCLLIGPLLGTTLLSRPTRRSQRSMRSLRWSTRCSRRSSRSRRPTSTSTSRYATR